MYNMKLFVVSNIFVCNRLHQLLGDTGYVSIGQNTQLHWPSHLWSRGMSSSCCKSGRADMKRQQSWLPREPCCSLLLFSLTCSHSGICVSHLVCMCSFECVASSFIWRLDPFRLIKQHILNCGSIFIWACEEKVRQQGVFRWEGRLQIRPPCFINTFSFSCILYYEVFTVGGYKKGEEELMKYINQD